MATNYKTPPLLGPDTIYEAWKNEIGVWRRMTSVEKKRQALAVVLSSLEGRAKETALSIELDTLDHDDGMNKLLEALDGLFKKNAVDAAYEAYSKFDTLKKEDGMSMTEYILEYEQRYKQCQKSEMTLPDAVLSFKLLDTCGLNKTERQMVLTAATDLKYDTMKSALKRIFGKSQSEGENGAMIKIKEEPENAYWTQTRRNSKFDKRNSSRWPASSEKSDTSTTLPGKNPLNRFGRRSRCAICQSIFHWAKDCPENNDSHTEAVKTVSDVDPEKSESCNITLFTAADQTDEIFMTEALGCAVLDTACTRTVCGTKWLDNYVENLNDDEKRSIQVNDSDRNFRFGDGAQVKSCKKVIIPVKIGETSCKICTEVVDANIPLLLSKESLKAAKTVLDIDNDKAMMFKKPIKLEFTSSGHYCVKLRDEPGKSFDFANGECTDVLILTDDMTEDKQRTILTKLHRQFGHASFERLLKLLQNAGNTSSNVAKLLKEVVENCKICIKLKRPSPKPAVGFPLATDFNETIAVDLHELDKNLWYLHIIDEFTRFSAAVIMKTKRSSVFVNKFIRHWIGIHGAPKKLYSDNGGEFRNEEVHDMCENFNIEVKTTGAYSPWSNGLLERHNKTLTDIVLKIKKDNNVDWKVALSWAVMAKNSLCNINGFSASQLVFGRNPNLPSILVDKLPALEGTTSSHTVADHIKSLYLARQEFIKAESSERLRRAVRKQTRPAPNYLVSGDKVYYKRPDNVEWKGPATVIGQDGAVVFLRHGGTVVRAHQSRVQLHNDNQLVVDNASTGDSDIATNGNNFSNPEVNEANKETVEIDTDDHETKSVINHDFDVDQQIITGDIMSEPTNLRPKAGQHLEYRHTESGEVMKAKVLSRAGKATGKNKFWYNLEYTKPDETQGERQSVDLSRVQDLKFTNEPEEVMVTENISFEQAKGVELENWQKNNVYEEIDFHGQNCISTRWICTLKETTDGIIPKARLVVRGFEEMDKEGIPTDSPTCGKDSLRVILSIFAQNKWLPHSMDIKTAFLQGLEIQRDIFIKPPNEAKSSGKIWKLKKCVYGLSDASLHWYNMVKYVMKSCHAHISTVDPAVFYWLNSDGKVKGILACHVDDFIWGGTTEFESTVIKHIKEKLNIGKEDSETFKFLGIGLCSDQDNITLDQKAYIGCLQPIQINKDRASKKDENLNSEEMHELRSKIGQLSWIAYQSRPDIIFDTCVLAADIKNAKVQHLIDINKLVKRVKSENISLKFENLQTSEYKLVIFSDSSFGNLNNGGSQGAFVIFLLGQNGQCCPLSWNSKRIRRVVRSTLAAETLAMADALDEGVFICILFSELMYGKIDPKLLPLICVTDSKSLFEAIKSTKSVTEKRLRMEISGIKELKATNQVKDFIWTNSGTQLADSLTKKGASPLLLLKTLEQGKLEVQGHRL